MDRGNKIRDCLDAPDIIVRCHRREGDRDFSPRMDRVNDDYTFVICFVIFDVDPSLKKRNTGGSFKSNDARGRSTDSSITSRDLTTRSLQVTAICFFFFSRDDSPLSGELLFNRARAEVGPPRRFSLYVMTTDRAREFGWEGRPWLRIKETEVRIIRRSQGNSRTHPSNVLFSDLSWNLQRFAGIGSVLLGPPPSPPGPTPLNSISFW